VTQPQPSQSSMTLEELNAESDRAREEFCKIPMAERRAYWDDKQPGRVADAYARMKAIGEQIADHPDTRDFEADLREALGKRMRINAVAGQVYSALCNVNWTHEGGTRYSCSWRYAGGLVAEIRGVGEDYLDFYCGGREGHVSDLVSAAMHERGACQKQHGRSGWRHSDA
jgi:hypothetical protein